MSPIYGRDGLVWEDLVTEALSRLAEQARLERLTSYPELNTVLARRTGHAAFDFGSDRDRAPMGQLLGDCVERTYPTVGAMVSSIVVYLNANDAGSGFYALAAEMGLLSRKPSSVERDAFWAQQVRAVHTYYGGAVAG